MAVLKGKKAWFCRFVCLFATTETAGNEPKFYKKNLVCVVGCYCRSNTYLLILSSSKLMKVKYILTVSRTFSFVEYVHGTFWCFLPFLLYLGVSADVITAGTPVENGRWKGAVRVFQLKANTVKISIFMMWQI